MRFTTFTAPTVVAVVAIALLTGCASGSAPSAAGDGEDGSLDLISAGTLTACANLEIPPNIYAEADGTPVGVEVDIAKAMAAELDLDVEFKEVAFSGLIPALQAKQCDVVISSLYIKPEREEVADFVPYLRSGAGVAIAADSEGKITGFDESLCGKNVIAITGATGAELAEERSTECVAAGAGALEITLVDKSSDAMQQVMAGQIDAFIDTSEIVGFYEKQSEGQIVRAGEIVGAVEIGAATLNSNGGLHDALQSAFDTLVDNGTYADILDEWGFSHLDITAR